MKNPILTKFKNSLSKDEFIVSFCSDDVLSIGIEDFNPLCFAVVEDDKPNMILLSFAVDFQDNMSSAKIALHASDFSKTLVAESFFMDQEGEMLWGEAAHERFVDMVMENEESELHSMKPINSLKC